MQGGGDSSETESAPPPEDDEEMMMEDFRFANELMSKQNSTPLKGDDDNPDDEFSLRFSGDEGNQSHLVLLFVFSCLEFDVKIVRSFVKLTIYLQLMSAVVSAPRIGRNLGTGLLDHQSEGASLPVHISHPHL